jgi:mycothiol synthase
MTTVIRSARPDDAPAIRSVMEASLAVDRLPGFNRAEIDRAIRRLIPAIDGTVVAVEGGLVVGYCTPYHDDLTVHPDARRRGHGRRLFEAGRAIVASQGDVELQLYVPNHLPGSEAFAEAMGLRYRSSLWQFHLHSDCEVPSPALPDDLVARTWDAVEGVSMEAWVQFMRSSFEGHPTRMSWRTDVVAHVHAQPEFDPTLVLTLAPSDDPLGLVAFTRIEVMRDDTGACVGEVGLIGVLPAWRRRGLGRELLRWGVATLRGRGAGMIALSVEASNDHATAMYRAHGFEPAIEWPHWVMPVG